MVRYRGKNSHREAHPKIFIWSHTEKAEIEYFQEFKNHLQTPLLSPRKEICWTPHELIKKVIEWKNKKINEEDGDKVWCIFDVDDFYKTSKKEFLKAIKEAKENNIKIAYINECFELWVLLHFERPSTLIPRGKAIEKKIQQAFKKNNLGDFKKNQKIFHRLIPFQTKALQNANKLLSVSYEEIDWEKVLSEKGNPSTTIHLLVQEIIDLFKK